MTEIGMCLSNPYTGVRRPVSNIYIAVRHLHISYDTVGHFFSKAVIFVSKKLAGIKFTILLCCMEKSK